MSRLPQPVWSPLHAAYKCNGHLPSRCFVANSRLNQLYEKVWFLNYCQFFLCKVGKRKQMSLLNVQTKYNTLQKRQTTRQAVGRDTSQHCEITTKNDGNSGTRLRTLLLSFLSFDPYPSSVVMHGMFPRKCQNSCISLFWFYIWHIHRSILFCLKH